jgi:hypothetical protein
MEYRINGHFADKWASSQQEDVMAGPVPKWGDTVSLTSGGQNVAMRVTAVWQSSVESGSVITVEAQQV